MLTSFTPLALLLVHPAKIEVWKAIGLVASRCKSLFEPGNGGIPLSLFDQVGADVVVRVAELRVNLDGLPAIRNCLPIVGLERMCPSAKCVCLCGREGLNGVGVKFNGLLVLPFLLMLICTAEVFAGPLPKFAAICHTDTSQAASLATRALFAILSN